MQASPTPVQISFLWSTPGNEQLRTNQQCSPPSRKGFPSEEFGLPFKKRLMNQVALANARLSFKASVYVLKFSLLSVLAGFMT